MVLGALPVEFLLEQKDCCGQGCTHCPYIDEAGERHHMGAVKVDEGWVAFIKANPDKSWEEYQAVKKAQR